MKPRAGFAVVALTLAAGACGGKADLSANARTQLAPLVVRLRHAAESFDAVDAQRYLTELQAGVAADKEHGQISSKRAAQILATAALVHDRLALIETTTTAVTTTTTSTTTSSTTTTTLPPRHGHGHGPKNHRDQGGGGNGND